MVVFTRESRLAGSQQRQMGEWLVSKYLVRVQYSSCATVRVLVTFSASRLVHQANHLGWTHPSLASAVTRWRRASAKVK